jgi:hypothetical protein
MRVYIQRHKGEFQNVIGYTAWKGFEQLGDEVLYFDIGDLENNRMELSKDTLVVGTIYCVRTALEKLGCVPPDNLDYPECLYKYLGRKVWRTTMRWLREQYNDVGDPVFVKPVRVHKAFTGYVVTRYRDLIPTARFDSDMELWASEVVDFVAEYRYFVFEHQVVGVGHYRGDPLRYPDPSIVTAAVRDYAPEAPVAYCIDFGVDKDGRTLLVEVNDGFAFGTYGLNSLVHVKMLEARWKEMVGTR